MRLFYLILLTACIHQALTMDCINITSQYKCNLVNANGCLWNGTACNGTFVASCLPPTCYYVDDYETKTTGAGTPSNPIANLSDAITKYATTNGTIIIMNYKENATATFYKIVAATVSTDITIKPLFDGTLWTMDFTKYPTPNASAIFFKVSRRLRIVGAIISSSFSSFITFFDVQNGNLTLENIYVIGSTFKANFIRIISTNTASLVSINGGLFYNSTVRLSTYGFLTIRNFRIEDVPSSVFSILGGLLVDNVTIRGSISTPVFSLSAGSNMTLQNSLIEKTNSTILSSTSAKRIAILNSTFQQLNPTNGQGAFFVNIKDLPSDGIASHVIQDCIIRNSTFPSSWLLVEKNGVQLSMINVTMEDILKGPSADEQPEYAAEWAGGVCGVTRNDAGITVVSSTFRKIHGHCFGFKSSYVVVRNSTFDNSALKTTQEQPSATLLGSLTDKSGISWIIIEDSTKVISPINTVILENNRFIRNSLIPNYGGALRVKGVISTQVYASSNEFIEITALYGGAIYSDNALVSLNLSNNTFMSTAAYDGGAVYKKSTEFYGKPYSLSFMSNADKFSNASAIRNGGCVYLDWESIVLNYTTFFGCSAQNGGGMYAINLDKYFNDRNGFLIRPTFIENKAVEVGGGLKIYFSYSYLKEDPSLPAIFINNQANKGKDISSEKPTSYLFLFYDILVEKSVTEFDDLSEWVTNTTRTKLAYSFRTDESTSSSSRVIQSGSTLPTRQITHKSGHEINQILVVEVRNGKDELVDYIKNEQISVEISETQNNISNFSAFVTASPIIFTFTDGQIFVKNNLKIIGEPKTSATLKFKGITTTSNILKDASLLMDFDIQVYFQDCEVGDIYNSLTKTCDTCSPGTYSLADPYGDITCLECDFSKAQCLGGSKIAPLPGFWRYDPNSPFIMECPADNACQGGLVTEYYYSHGICQFPYEGNLCNKCAINYAKFGSDDSCVDCQTDAIYYVKFVGFFALRVGAVLYSIKCNLNKISSFKRSRTMSGSSDPNKKLNSEDFQSNLMKIVVNFVQVSSIIIQYKFEWPTFVLDVVDVTNKFIPTEKDGFSVDCIVALVTGDNSYLYFIKLVVTLIQPFGLWIALTIFYIIYVKIKRESIAGNSKVKKNITVLFVITAFILQPSIVQSTLEMFKCQNYASSSDPVYYMVKDSEVKCWTPFHILWSVGIALPFFLLWGIVLPLTIVKKLISSAKNLQNPEIYARFAFVYEGLKSNRYYWEFVVLLRKTLIIVVFVFLNVISIQAQAFATFMIIFIFSVIHIKLSPYADSRLNRLEMLSLVTLGVMTYSGMFFLSGGSTQFTTILLIIISLIFNISFYLLTAFYFIQSYKAAAKRVARSVTSKISRSLERSKSKKSSNSSFTERRENSMEVKEVEDIMSDINSKLNKDNIESPDVQDYKKQSEEDDESGVPSEGDVNNKGNGVVYEGKVEEPNNYSIMKNSGYLGVQSGMHSGFQSFHNSTIGLLSPAGKNPNFALGNVNDSRYLKPGNGYPLESPMQAEEQLESPNMRRRLAMGYNQLSVRPESAQRSDMVESQRPMSQLGEMISDRELIEKREKEEEK